MRRGLRGLCFGGWEFLLLGWHCQTRFSRQKTRCVVKIDAEGHNKIRAHQLPHRRHLIQQSRHLSAAVGCADWTLWSLFRICFLFEPTCSLHMGKFSVRIDDFRSHRCVTFIHSTNMLYGYKFLKIRIFAIFLQFFFAQKV